MPRRAAGVPRMERIYLTLRPGDAEFLQRLAEKDQRLEELKARKKAPGAPSVSGAVRYLIDRYAEQLRAGDGHDQATLYWLRKGEQLPGYRELLLAEETQDYPAGYNWKLYRTEVASDNTVTYWIQWTNRHTRDTYIAPISPGEKPELPAEALGLIRESKRKQR